MKVHGKNKPGKLQEILFWTILFTVIMHVCVTCIDDLHALSLSFLSDGILLNPVQKEELVQVVFFRNSKYKYNLLFVTRLRQIKQSNQTVSKHHFGIGKM